MKKVLSLLIVFFTMSILIVSCGDSGSTAPSTSEYLIIKVEYYDQVADSSASVLSEITDNLKAEFDESSNKISFTGEQTGLDGRKLSIEFKVDNVDNWKDEFSNLVKDDQVIINHAFTNGGPTFYAKYETPSSGTVGDVAVTLSKLDPENGILEGKFSGELVNFDTGEVVKIKKGAFKSKSMVIK